jgi:hypothetical protein
MDDELKCPHCEWPMPETAVSGVVDALTEDDSRSHATCPKCGTNLVRSVDPDSPPELAQWRQAD